jgi:hypothetical protein
MRTEKLEQIITSFNEGDWEDEWGPHFNNDIILFLSLINKHGLIDLVDVFADVDYIYNNQNKILLYLIKTNPEEWFNIICTKVIGSDLLKSEDGYYLEVHSREEVAELFYDSRRESTRDIVKSVLSEDDDNYDRFWNTTDDIYRDVIDELSEKNLELLKLRMTKILLGELVEPGTELLETMINNGSTEVLITNENLNELVKDEESLKFLIENYCDDIKSDLYSLHSNCYNSAYNDEIYEKIFNSLDEFFVGKFEDFERNNKYDSSKKFWMSKIKIKDLYGDITHFLEESDHYTNNLNYLGNYMEMLKHGMSEGMWEYLDFNIPDYADSYKVDECINQIFPDYM